MEQIKEEEARERALQEVKLYQSNDWDIKEERPEYFLLTRNTQTITGHIFIFIFTVWFSFGLLNLAYWGLCRKTKKIIK